MASNTGRIPLQNASTPTQEARMNKRYISTSCCPHIGLITKPLLFKADSELIEVPDFNVCSPFCCKEVSTFIFHPGVYLVLCCAWLTAHTACTVTAVHIEWCGYAWLLSFTVLLTLSLFVKDWALGFWFWHSDHSQQKQNPCVLFCRDQTDCQ